MSSTLACRGSSLFLRHASSIYPSGWAGQYPTCSHSGQVRAPRLFLFQHRLCCKPAQIALACLLLPKQRTTRRWSRPDVLAGLAILTILAVILRLELIGLLIPLAIQAWMIDRVDWLEGGFTMAVSALASLSEYIKVTEIWYRS